MAETTVQAFGIGSDELPEEHQLTVDTSTRILFCERCGATSAFEQGGQQEIRRYLERFRTTPCTQYVAPDTETAHTLAKTPAGTRADRELVCTSCHRTTPVQPTEEQAALLSTTVPCRQVVSATEILHRLFAPRNITPTCPELGIGDWRDETVVSSPDYIKRQLVHDRSRTRLLVEYTPVTDAITDIETYLSMIDGPAMELPVELPRTESHGTAGSSADGGRQAEDGGPATSRDRESDGASEPHSEAGRSTGESTVRQPRLTLELPTQQGDTKRTTVEFRSVDPTAESVHSKLETVLNVLAVIDPLTAQEVQDTVEQYEKRAQEHYDDWCEYAYSQGRERVQAEHNFSPSTLAQSVEALSEREIVRRFAVGDSLADIGEREYIRSVADSFEPFSPIETFISSNADRRIVFAEQSR